MHILWRNYDLVNLQLIVENENDVYFRISTKSFLNFKIDLVYKNKAKSYVNVQNVTASGA